MIYLIVGVVLFGRFGSDKSDTSVSLILSAVESHRNQFG